MDALYNQERPQAPRLLRTEDVADTFRISHSAVRRMVLRGELTPIQIGRSVRFRIEEVERIANGQSPTKAP